MKSLLKYFSFLLIALVAVSPVAANILQTEILGVKWGTDISVLKDFVNWTLFPIEKGETPKNLKPEDLPNIPILRF